MKHMAGQALSLLLASALLVSTAQADAAPGKAQKPVPYPVLSTAGAPEDVGFSSPGLQQVDALIEREIAAGFPGAALIIIKDGKIVKSESYGYRQKFSGDAPLAEFSPMETDTLFDLASNTKMYATNFALQKLVSEGKLDLQARVGEYLPEFRDTESDGIKGKDSLRIVDILQHSAGFTADPQYHNPEVAGELYSQDRDKTLRQITGTPLAYRPGTRHVYSDVDYMLLGLIVERITGQRLDRYAEQTLYEPLGLENTLFTPLQKGFEAADFAATELRGNSRGGTVTFPNIRTGTLLGQVHDEKAFYSMAGVSGHAGLFSTTGDLAVLLQVMLNGGGYGNQRLFDRETIDRFTAPSTSAPTYALGWRVNGDEGMQWMFGPDASAGAYGHTGWTGTLTVIDPENNLGIVLLTNKKHSPVIKSGGNTGKFIGDLFSVGRYGSVVTAIYRALL